MKEYGNWVKIGETIKQTSLFKTGNYSRYAVMEMICKSGMRKYKEVLMCSSSWDSRGGDVKSQPE